jgi:hypothetical protein
MNQVKEMNILLSGTGFKIDHIAFKENGTVEGMTLNDRKFYVNGNFELLELLLMVSKVETNPVVFPDGRVSGSLVRIANPDYIRKMQEFFRVAPLDKLKAISA